MTRELSRRGFLGSTLAAAGMAASAGALTPGKALPWDKPPVCVFSKHLQFLNYEQLAAASRDLGFDGVDLTVREKGHVLPERLAEDLPRACKAIRGAGLQVAMITTRLLSAQDKDAEPILNAAAAHDIPYLRVGNHRYEDGDILEQAQRFTEEMKGLAELATAHGVTLGYHNHSGRGNFGAALWDLQRAYASIGNAAMGSNLDLGHTKAEGAYGAWDINTRLLAPHTKMISVKDFVWEEDKPKWVPLGTGIVPTGEMLKLLRATGFNGPISVHVEYDLENDQAMLEEMRKAVPTLRAALGEAGY